MKTFRTNPRKFCKVNRTKMIIKHKQHVRRIAERINKQFEEERIAEDKYTEAARMFTIADC